MLRATLIALVMTLCVSCQSYSPREKAAAVFTGTVGGPLIAANYVSAVLMAPISYVAAWIRGNEQGSTRIWFSTHIGPDYQSSNSPWCWLYVGREPEARVLANDMAAGSHLREIPLSSVQGEYPPAATWCRTGKDQFNTRGDENYPVVMPSGGQ